MTTDYDAPRTQTDDLDEDSLDGLVGGRTGVRAAVIDIDETEAAESLPDAEFSVEELSVLVVPIRSDEFTCSSCFLVQHRSRLASQQNGQALCADCA